MKQATQIEHWKPIKDYEDIYMISDCGRVWSVGRKVRHPKGRQRNVNPRIRKLANDGYGYSIITLHKDGERITHKVHQLVIQHFGPARPSAAHEVNHKDGNKRNNHIQNLEWVTRSENVKHACFTGLRINKFTDIEIKAIRAIRSKYHFTYKEIASAAGCSHKHIGAIIRKERYK